MAERTKLCIRVDSALAGRLAPAAETALYRIMQEGLTNIAKHAAATHVDLQLWQDDERGLLRDDGIGFAVEHDGPDRAAGPRSSRIQERLEASGTSRSPRPPGRAQHSRSRCLWQGPTRSRAGPRHRAAGHL